MNTSDKKKKLTLFALTWPIFIEILLHMLMGNADTLMLSQYSDNAVAAVGVSNQIMSVVIVMFGFIATGSAIVVAQYIGAEQFKKANQVTIVAISTNLIFGLLLSVILFVFGEPILKVMALPVELMGDALGYIEIVGGLVFIQALIMTTSAILRSHGHSKDTMYVTIGMNILNVIGNFLFIFGPFGFPVLGVQGVAISTIISRFIGLGVIFFLLTKRINKELPWASFFSFPKEHLKKLLRIGIPAAGEHLSYNTSQMAITYFIAMLGTEAITTKVYAQNLMMFIFLFSVAIGQGTQIMIGHQVGAGKIEAAYNRCMKSLKIAMVISTGTAVLFYLFSDSLLGIFTDNMDIISLGGTLLLLTAILEPGRAFNLVVINSLRAAGDVKFPVYIGIIFMWGVSVPIAYVLAIKLGMGLIGIWISFIIDEWVRGLLMLWRWRSRKWQSMSFVEKKEEQYSQ